MNKMAGEIKIPTRVIPKRQNGEEHSRLLELINNQRQKQEQEVKSAVEMPPIVAENKPATIENLNPTVIEVSNLVKIFQGQIRAVDNISFSVKQGEFFGFLGPNGAGKTTTMKILGTLVKKSSGTAKVLGVDAQDNADFIRHQIGFALQEISLDQLATGKETLVLQGVLHHISKKEAEERASELLELFKLTDAAKRPVGTYSGGMKRRIDLASVLVHKPKILFLDEPTEGLDPQSRQSIWEYLKQLNQNGVTIFLTTHYMEEADSLCTRLAIIDQGKIVAMDTPENLKRSIGADIINLTFDPSKGPINAETTKSVLLKIGDISEVKLLDSTISVFTQNGAGKVPTLLNILNQEGVKVESISVSRPSLNDVFLKYTGHQIREEETKTGGVNPMMRMWVRGGSKK